MEAVRSADSFVADPGEGAHIAVLYRGPDGRDEVLIPYLAGARSREEGALCVTAVDPEEFAGHVDRVAGARGSVEVLRTEDSYLHGGAFSASAMSGWLSQVGQAAPRGSDARRLRIAGDLSWIEALGQEGFDELIAYETSLNSIAPACRHSLACFYDLGQLDADQVVALLRAHPRVVIDGALWDSPFYVDAAGEAANDADRAAAPDDGGRGSES
ncbi:MAG: MEDS domain-containing protein [Sporichthyaceae bacterium]